MPTYESTILDILCSNGYNGSARCLIETQNLASVTYRSLIMLIYNCSVETVKPLLDHPSIVSILNTPDKCIALLKMATSKECSFIAREKVDTVKQRKIIILDMLLSNSTLLALVSKIDITKYSKLKTIIK